MNARPAAGARLLRAAVLTALAVMVLSSTAPAAGAARPTAFYDVDFVSKSVGWAVGTPSAIYKTTDGGQTWHRQRLAGSLWLTACDFSDAGRGWVTGTINEGEPAVILRTTNGGTTWQWQANPVPSCDVFTDVQAISAGRAVIVGRIGTIIRTTNGGATWVSVPSGLAPGPGAVSWPGFNSVDFPTRSVGYAVGSQGDLLKSSDGGASWRPLPSLAGMDPRAVRFVGASTGWIVGGAGLILKTTNGGRTWTRQPSGTSNWLVAVDFVDRYHGWAVGSDGTVLHTTNGGKRWTHQGSGTTAFLSAVDLRTRAKGLIAGDKRSTVGIILRSGDGGRHWARKM
jgi:photosystem II stability/assembly factor-like uncharacterized protein